MVNGTTAIYRFSIEEAFTSVRSGSAGLTSAEAARRLAEYGPNQIRRTARKPALVHSCVNSSAFSPLFYRSPQGFYRAQRLPNVAKQRSYLTADKERGLKEPRMEGIGGSGR